MSTNTIALKMLLQIFLCHAQSKCIASMAPVVMNPRRTSLHVVILMADSTFQCKELSLAIMVTTRIVHHLTSLIFARKITSQSIIVLDFSLQTVHSHVQTSQGSAATVLVIIRRNWCKMLQKGTSLHLTALVARSWSSRVCARTGNVLARTPGTGFIHAPALP